MQAPLILDYEIYDEEGPCAPYFTGRITDADGRVICNAENEERAAELVDYVNTLRARVARLEEALGKIRDYDCYKHPDDDIIAIREAAIKESENCTACQHAKKAKWPPSGLCNEHYRTVTRAQERVSQMFSHKQTWGPREIARRALEEK